MNSNFSDQPQLVELPDEGAESKKLAFFATARIHNSVSPPVELFLQLCQQKLLECRETSFLLEIGKLGVQAHAQQCIKTTVLRFVNSFFEYERDYFIKLSRSAEVIVGKFFYKFLKVFGRKFVEDGAYVSFELVAGDSRTGLKTSSSNM